ncbi:diaminopimelate decarboxylase [Hypericibacter sp.]|uniref:diaminopimelate decarboxylase n=1 Tax=Hypericibacter sp. TaxID=2705401 RepID=UPI003D6C8473
MNAKPAMGQDWKIEGYRGSEQGRLTMDGVDLVTLAHERGTPFFVYSARRIAETARTMKTVFAASHPRSTICYAAKALSTIKVLRLLHAEGIALEVNSGGELFRAKLAGIPPDSIVFNGVAKSKAEISEALSPPIKAINVDSLFELERIGEVAADLGCQARVTLRIVPEVDSPTSPGNRTGSEGTKFGILLQELDRAMALLRAQPNALRLVGIHAHVGSQITDTGPYVSAAHVLVEQARRLQDGLGLRLEHVNLGGGFPLPYMRGVNRTPQGDIFAPRIDSADIARAGLAPLRKGLGEQIEILVEPGRRMVGDAAVTLSTVETVKTRAGHDWLYLDAGYNTIVESYTYKWYYHSITANKIDEPLSEFRVVGPLCDNGDAFFDVDGEQTLVRLLKADPKLAQSRELLESTLVRLPPTRKLAGSTGPGDIIAFLDTGAYTLDQITPNNGRPRPEVGMLDLDGRYEVMRRRDTYTDLLFNEVI